jgi:hypothetical protein
MTLATVNFLAILMGVSPGCHSQDPAEILLPGQALRGDVSPPSGNQWFAVLHSAEGWALVHTTPQVAVGSDACADSVLRVSAPNAEDALFLVRGLPKLTAGPLPTGFAGRRFLHPGESMTVVLGERDAFVFQALGTASRRETGEVIITDYELLLKRYQRAQVMASLPRIALDSHVEIVWAGDLDADDRLDALLDLSPSYASHRYVLFVSSLAWGEDLVTQVAERAVAGC